MGVRAVDREVDCSAPHGTFIFALIEAFLPGVDVDWVCATGAIEKHLDLRVLAMLHLQFFPFVIELPPQSTVLNSLDF